MAGGNGGRMSGRDREVLERIRRGLLYTESEASFQNPQRRSDLIFEYNQTRPSDTRRRRSLLEAILGSVGARTVLLSPFHAGFGSNVHIGDDFFGNVNLTFVDDVEIRIGNGVMIAPGVTLTTTGHPIHPDLRPAESVYERALRADCGTSAGSRVRLSNAAPTASTPTAGSLHASTRRCSGPARAKTRGARVRHLPDHLRPLPGPRHRHAGRMGQRPAHRPTAPRPRRPGRM